MKKYLPWIGAMGIAAGLMAVLSVMAVPAAFAQTMGPGGWGGHGRGTMMRGAPGVFGTVTSVDDAAMTLTVTQKLRPNATTSPAVYTVNAGNAAIYKNGATSTISSVVAGDSVMVQGTVTGTTVAATVIRDGVMMGKRGSSTPFTTGAPGMGARGFGFARGATTTPPIQGNGQPVIGGSITAITGTTLTVTNASNITYTVDASSTKFIKNGTTTPLSNAVIGDSVVVQGAVNGTSVGASSIIDQGTGTSSGAQAGTPSARGGFGFFGAIGNFFKHLFGF